MQIKAEDISVVCAIESGKLEQQTALMLSMLRSFGGSLAKSKVLAFRGRKGSDLLSCTKEILHNLDVIIIENYNLNRAPWFNYSNKVAAIEFAQSFFESKFVLWLDSDILILREPTFFRNNYIGEADFVARFEHYGPITTPQSNPIEPFMKMLGHICECDLLEMQYAELDFPNKKMKPYFNSGVMIWRRSSNFAGEYSANFYKIVNSNLSPKGVGPWFADQFAILPTIVKLHLNWKLMHIEDHLILFSHDLGDCEREKLLSHSAIIHYSKSRSGENKSRFDSMIVGCMPQFGSIANQIDNLYRETRGPSFNIAELLYRIRQRAYLAMCREI